MAAGEAAGSLHGKVALVSGCTSGIGLETAKELAVRGATVIMGVRNLEAAKRVVDQVKAAHPKVKMVVPKTPLDLMSQDSVRKFAQEVNAGYNSLDILINNAGISFMKKCFTDDGVGGIAQTNYLGPYTLTRLLEKKLVASKARVVTVSSITHREKMIKDPQAFLTDWRSGFYQHSKLANVLFAYELQRRLGLHGITSCVADPGGVRSNIFSASPLLSKGIYKHMIDMCYSPPEDGAKSTIHAAAVPWEQERPTVNGSPASPAHDLRYYSRGLFNHPLITYLDGVRDKGVGAKQSALGVVWALNALGCSLVDWPARKLSGGWIFSGTRTVRSSTQSYDEELAAKLWDASADTAHVPRQPAV